MIAIGLADPWRYHEWKLSATVNDEIDEKHNYKPSLKHSVTYACCLCSLSISLLFSHQLTATRKLVQQTSPLDSFIASLWSAASMLGLSRFARLFLLVTVLVLLPTLYLLYPSLAAPRSPEDEVFEYESGGIDSTHWRAPIKPDFEQEELRDWSDACVAGEDCGAAQEQVGEQGVGQVSLEKDREVGAGEDMVLGGGVIMPKFENATAK